MRRVETIVSQARAELRRKGSPAVARNVQRFFKEPVPAYGWRTAEVRRLGQRLRRELAADGGPRLLLVVAEKLFAGPTIEEQSLGVFLLERAVRRFGAAEFRRLERWLRHVNNWAACDALSVSLLGAILLGEKRSRARVHRWAWSRNLWYRRAAAVALVPAARRGVYANHIFRVATRLLGDEEEMVQKGVGWLLREAGKARHPRLVPFLLRVKHRAPRLVLRTACEKLPARARRRILA